jgi:hypothetical protein
LPIERFELKYAKRRPNWRRGQCKACRAEARRLRKAVRKTCSVCGKKKLLSEFQWYAGDKRRAASYLDLCLDCSRPAWRQRQLTTGRKNANAWKKFAGGKCCRCGYNKCSPALEFHHINPKTKSFSLASKIHRCNPADSENKMTQSVKREMLKCILVCANCHRELEYPD